VATRDLTSQDDPRCSGDVGAPARPPVTSAREGDAAAQVLAGQVQQVAEVAPPDQARGPVGDGRVAGAEERDQPGHGGVGFLGALARAGGNPVATRAGCRAPYHPDHHPARRPEKIARILMLFLMGRSVSTDEPPPGAGGPGLDRLRPREPALSRTPGMRVRMVWQEGSHPDFSRGYRPDNRGGAAWNCDNTGTCWPWPTSAPSPHRSGRRARRDVIPHAPGASVGVTRPGREQPGATPVSTPADRGGPATRGRGSAGCLEKIVGPRAAAVITPRHHSQAARVAAHAAPSGG
jgi:hypothetical protein